MTYTILRPTLVYGPGNPGNMERLIKLIRSRLPLPLAALPNKRSFVYVGNLVAAIQACIGHNGAANQLFLISDGEDFSTPGLMRQLGKALGCTVWLWPCPIWVLRWLGRLTGQQATIERLTGSLVVDSSRIRQVLGWHPPFRAAQGLAATATWVREQHKK
jgi:nucleoside-diphosphate-sugar epimerase